MYVILMGIININLKETKCFIIARFFTFGERSIWEQNISNALRIAMNEHTHKLPIIFLHNLAPYQMCFLSQTVLNMFLKIILNALVV